MANQEATQFRRLRSSTRWVLLLALHATLTAGAFAQGRIITVGTALVVGGVPDFLDLPEAVAAASPGDLLLMGSGPFSPTTIDIGITIDAISTIGSQDLVVENIPAGEKFVLVATRDSTDLHIRNCQGEIVVLGRVSVLTFPPGFFANLSSTVVSNCASVTIESSDISRLVIDNSCVQIRNSRIRGLPVIAPFGPLAYPAAMMRDSDVTISGFCTLSSTFAVGPGAAEIPCIDMVGGTLRLEGDVFLQGGQSILEDAQDTVLFGPAIRSFGGSVVIDSAATLARDFGLPFTGDSPFMFETRPPLGVVLFTPPFAHRLELHGNPGASAWLLVSFPASRLPTPFGDFWLDPFGSTQVVASGVIDSVTGTFAAMSPQLVLPPGSILHYQAIVADASGIWLSNPAIVFKGVR